ncbi:hypothetical protein M0813_29652 [Anaeramoeba flamelloides]|uniref:Uncharacterized protein n=1 Tax=Anaeramoeba flamelloides TaxID=1746091 RepID=A0ABQ8XMN6_9EUKA|nr:hypothetical protein M0813_29652 [Anaeramoeba flamelloides]
MKKSDTTDLLAKKFRKIRSMNDRLILFLEVFPNSIKGLQLEDLKNLKERKKLNKQLLKKNKSISTNQKQRQCQIPKPSPHKITIVRNSLAELANLTGVSRRSLERGLSNFFERNYSLHNICPYSRDNLVFGDANYEGLSKNKKMDPKKQRLKKKKKIIRVKSDLGSNKTTKAKKIEFNEKVHSQNNQVVHKKEQSNLGASLRNHYDNNLAVNTRLNVLQTRSDILQNNPVTNTSIRISPITRKRENKYIGQIYCVQEEKYISVKSPLHMLCELSQIYKKSRSNYLFQKTIQQPTNNQNIFPENITNYKHRNNNVNNTNDNNLLDNNPFHL